MGFYHRLYPDHTRGPAGVVGTVFRIFEAVLHESFQITYRNLLVGGEQELIYLFGIVIIVILARGQDLMADPGTHMRIVHMGPYSVGFLQIQVFSVPRIVPYRESLLFGKILEILGYDEIPAVIVLGVHDICFVSEEGRLILRKLHGTVLMTRIRLHIPCLILIGEEISVAFLRSCRVDYLR